MARCVSIVMKLTCKSLSVLDFEIEVTFSKRCFPFLLDCGSWSKLSIFIDESYFT